MTAEWLFTENETNFDLLFGVPSASPYVKDAFHRHVVNGDKEAVNPDQTGTKAAAHFILTVPAGEQKHVWIRFINDMQDTGEADDIAVDAAATPASPEEAASVHEASKNVALDNPFACFVDMCKLRLDEADEFYRAVQV